MKIWIDIENLAHYHAMDTIGRELANRGYLVRYSSVGGHIIENLEAHSRFKPLHIPKRKYCAYPNKVYSVLKRSWYLYRCMCRWKPDIALGHGSRSLAIAAMVQNTKSITLIDYEWVDTSIYNALCDIIILPHIISDKRYIEAKINISKAARYSGFKELLYIPNLSQNIICGTSAPLDSDVKRVLVRPPALSAHYHDVTTEEVFSECLSQILKMKNCQILYLSRIGQRERFRGLFRANAQVTVLQKPLSLLELYHGISHVITGGGTISREAAVLGIPSLNCFHGMRGMVDSYLEKLGRMHFPPLSCRSGYVADFMQRESGGVGVLDHRSGLDDIVAIIEAME